MTCATRNYQHLGSQARSRSYHRYEECVTCLPFKALLIVLAREKDKSSGLIFIAFVVAIVAFYHYSRRRGARPIRINQGWYTLGKQMDTSNVPPDEGVVDTADSDSIPAAHRAHCAAELRGTKTLLARGGRNVDVRKTKAHIRKLEAQLQPT
ncbi:hypothetical protein B0H10DRAFT_1942241 [Mycena sp. CBHHK59/15]|nr:hypothetical protein B0H10DRAFT_1942241 [Mycena sp. CBHHK59/15]